MTHEETIEKLREGTLEAIVILFISSDFQTDALLVSWGQTR